MCALDRSPQPAHDQTYRQEYPGSAIICKVQLRMTAPSLRSFL